MSFSVEEFKAKLEPKVSQKPILKGTIQEYKGKTQVSLWDNPGFKEVVKEAVKEAIKEVMK